MNTDNRTYEHINEDLLAQIIPDYSLALAERFPKEVYKWKAIKWFQDHFDLEAEDFAGMLETVLQKAGNLLSRKHFLAKDSIIECARYNPEHVRKMFRVLFDENVPLIERFQVFKKEAEIFYEIYPTGNLKTYQNDNSISTYLFFQYPEKCWNT